MQMGGDGERLGDLQSEKRPRWWRAALINSAFINQPWRISFLTSQHFSSARCPERMSGTNRKNLLNHRGSISKWGGLKHIQPFVVVTLCCLSRRHSLTNKIFIYCFPSSAVSLQFLSLSRHSAVSSMGQWGAGWGRTVHSGVEASAFNTD